MLACRRSAPWRPWPARRPHGASTLVDGLRRRSAGPWLTPGSKPLPTLMVLDLVGQLLRRSGRRRRPAHRGGSRTRRSGRRCGTCWSSRRRPRESMSASSNTMNGALPPSSSDSFLIVGAHCAIRMRPTSVEPVNDRWRTVSRCAQHLADLDRILRVGGDHVEHAGRHAGALRQFGAGQRRQRRRLGRLDRSPGSRRPAPAPTLRVIIAIGKFHGVMAAHTPIGCLITSVRLFGVGGRDGLAVDAACLPRRTTR